MVYKLQVIAVHVSVAAFFFLKFMNDYSGRL
jgi:hypothetical protein